MLNRGGLSPQNSLDFNKGAELHGTSGSNYINENSRWKCTGISLKSIFCMIYNVYDPPARPTGEILAKLNIFNGETSFWLPESHWRPIDDMGVKSGSPFSHKVPVIFRNLYGNKTAGSM